MYRPRQLLPANLLLSFVFFPVFLAFFAALGAARAEDSWTFADGVIRLHLPDSFRPVTMAPGAPEGLLLLARPAGEDYPSLNLIQAGGSFGDAAESSQTLGARLLQSYRNVGLLDTRLLSAQKVPGDPGADLTLRATLAYHNQQTAIISAVLIVSLTDRHYIVTVTDLDNSETRARYAGPEQPFRLEVLEFGRENSPDRGPGRITFTAMAVLLVLLVLLLPLLIRGRQARRKV